MDKTTLIILLLLFVTLIDFGNAKPATAIDLRKAEGYVAFIVNEEVPSTPIVNTYKCEYCKDTKKIVTGDGRSFTCPHCSPSGEVGVVSECECGCKEENCQCSVAAETSPVIDPVMRKHIKMYTADWCPPCTLFKRREIPKLKDIDIEFVDVDKNPGEPLIPSFHFYKDGKSIHKVTGYQTADQIRALWDAK